MCRGCRKLLHFDALASLSSLRDLAMPAASQDKDIAEVRRLICEFCVASLQNNGVKRVVDMPPAMENSVCRNDPKDDALVLGSGQGACLYLCVILT